jgi:hypothetical protein
LTFEVPLARLVSFQNMIDHRLVECLGGTESSNLTRTIISNVSLISKTLSQVYPQSASHLYTRLGVV